MISETSEADVVGVAGNVGDATGSVRSGVEVGLGGIRVAGSVGRGESTSCVASGCRVASSVGSGSEPDPIPPGAGTSARVQANPASTSANIGSSTAALARLDPADMSRLTRDLV